MKNLIVFIVFLTFAINVNAQFLAPTIQWQKSLGGTGDDEAYSMQQTRDGGYIVAGMSCSINGDVTGNQSNSNNYPFFTSADFWIVKLVTGIYSYSLILNDKVVDTKKMIKGN